MFLRSEVIITIKRFTDIETFSHETDHFLFEKESENCLILGLTNVMRKKKIANEESLFFGIYESSLLKGVAIRTAKSRPLSLSHINEEQSQCLCDEIIKMNLSLSGVVGESSAANNFSNAYTRAKKVESKLILHENLYELQNITVSNSSNKNLLLATSNETQIIVKFLKSFMIDCFNDDSIDEDDLKHMANIYIGNKTLYLLQDQNEFVAMAAINSETDNTACLSLIFTPMEYRGKGFGSLVTALLSKKILDEGKKTCTLFTDVENMTSNSIYKKLGFRLINSNKEFSFL